MSEVRSTYSRTLPFAEDHSIYYSLLRSGAAECSCEFGRDFPIEGGGMPWKLPNILSHKVAVALSVGSGVLDQAKVEAIPKA